MINHITPSGFLVICCLFLYNYITLLGFTNRGYNKQGVLPKPTYHQAT